MKKLLPILILYFLLIPNLTLGSSGDILYSAIVHLMFTWPYYLLALIPYFIQRFNKGRNLFFSILTYLLCLGAIALANYIVYGFGMPGFELESDDIIFYLLILPFVVIIILAAYKDYKYRKYRED